MSNPKKAFYANICLFLLEVFAVGWMMSGISGGVFTGARIRALRYFTVDSNILMGMIALLVAVDERKIIKGEKKDLSVLSYTLKLAGTVGVTLTMLITIFFLAPRSAATTGYFSLFYNSNLFLHLVNPLFSIVSFLLFEKTDRIPFRGTFAGVIPMLLYAVYYVEEAIRHSKDGVIAVGYDWYGFCFDGVRSVVTVLPVLVLLTCGISFVLWKWNRK